MISKGEKMVNIGRYPRPEKDAFSVMIEEAISSPYPPKENPEKELEEILEELDVEF